MNKYMYLCEHSPSYIFNSVLFSHLTTYVMCPGKSKGSPADSGIARQK